MSYLTNFERSFSEHTLELVKEYNGNHDKTLLVNCLLGLLVVPKETALDAIPEDPLDNLAKWGINPASIKEMPDPKTLRNLVKNLRHAVAHFKISPIPATSDVHSFEYKNERGLHAVISTDEMRDFVTRLSRHLAAQ